VLAASASVSALFRFAIVACATIVDNYCLTPPQKKPPHDKTLRLHTHAQAADLEATIESLVEGQTDETTLDKGTVLVALLTAVGLGLGLGVGVDHT
jgi:hypothetical protein